MTNSLPNRHDLFVLLLLSSIGVAKADLRAKVDSTTPPPAPLQTVRPVLECVTQTNDTTFTAYFGYLNPNSVTVTVPIGNTNRFSPSPIDRGQPVQFLPGRQVSVFAVPFKGGNQVWLLQGRTSTASRGSKRCATSTRMGANAVTTLSAMNATDSAAPTPLQTVRPVLECVTQDSDTSYTAYYGYLNPNTVSVTVAVGSGNRFNPSPIDRGQPTVFMPGRQRAVFAVPFRSGNQVWNLQGRTSTAGTSSKRCTTSARRGAGEPMSAITIFPNPADGEGFNVQMSNPDLAVPTLYTMQGSNVPIRHRVLCETQLEVRPNTKLNSGMYILKVTEGNVSRSVKVLIR